MERNYINKENQDFFLCCHPVEDIKHSVNENVWPHTNEKKIKHIKLFT